MESTRMNDSKQALASDPTHRALTREEIKQAIQGAGVVFGGPDDELGKVVDVVVALLDGPGVQGHLDALPDDYERADELQKRVAAGEMTERHCGDFDHPHVQHSWNSAYACTGTWPLDLPGGPIVTETQGGHRRDPLTETLARIGRDMAQQRMAAEHHKRLGLDDRHHYHEYHRHEQGRWAFYESARLICQHFGRDFEPWLNEWEPTE